MTDVAGFIHHHRLYSIAFQIVCISPPGILRYFIVMWKKVLPGVVHHDSSLSVLHCCFHRLLARYWYYETAWMMDFRVDKTGPWNASWKAVAIVRTRDDKALN